MSARTSTSHRSLATAQPERAHPPRACGRTDVWRPWTLAWFGACALAFVNAVARQAIYEGQVGDLRAHHISTVTLLVLFAIYVWLLHRRWPIDTIQAALGIGATWAVMTAVFEFGFGHYVVGQSWSELLEACNLADGRVWVLVPIWTLVAPAVMRKVQQPRPR